MYDATTPDCPFCPIPAGVRVLKYWNSGTYTQTVCFEPLNPVVPGHLLIVPTQHVRDIADSPGLAAAVMACASEVAALIGDCNVITSKGKHATQTVFHLHVHVVPRREGDGLALPWTNQGKADLNALSEW